MFGRGVFFFMKPPLLFCGVFHTQLPGSVVTPPPTPLRWLSLVFNFPSVYFTGPFNHPAPPHPPSTSPHTPPCPASPSGNEVSSRSLFPPPLPFRLESPLLLAFFFCFALIPLPHYSFLPNSTPSWILDFPVARSPVPRSPFCFYSSSLSAFPLPHHFNADGLPFIVPFLHS